MLEPPTVHRVAGPIVCVVEGKLVTNIPG